MIPLIKRSYLNFDDNLILNIKILITRKAAFEKVRFLEGPIIFSRNSFFFSIPNRGPCYEESAAIPRNNEPDGFRERRRGLEKIHKADIFLLSATQDTGKRRKITVKREVA